MAKIKWFLEVTISLYFNTFQTEYVHLALDIYKVLNVFNPVSYYDFSVCCFDVQCP